MLETCHVDVVRKLTATAFRCSLTNAKRVVSAYKTKFLCYIDIIAYLYGKCGSHQLRPSLRRDLVCGSSVVADWFVPKELLDFIPVEDFVLPVNENKRLLS